MRIALTDNQFVGIERTIKSFLKENLYKELVIITKKIPRLDNDVSYTPIITALRRGDIVYKDGLFHPVKGRFDIRISQILSSFAKYDRQQNAFSGVPPGEILKVAHLVEDRNRKIYDALLSALERAEGQLELALGHLQLPIENPLSRMSDEIDKDLRQLGVRVLMPSDVQERLREEYIENQKYNIKNWSSEQITSMRQDLLEQVQDGFSPVLFRKQLEHSWGLSQNKAQFIARQESSLLLSAMKRIRYTNEGYTLYKWSTSHDQRVRPANEYQRKAGDDHRHLNGHIFTFGQPPIVNLRTGRRAEPGEDFGCRCVAIVQPKKD